MMRWIFMVLAVLALASCGMAAPRLAPDNAQGEYFPEWLVTAPYAPKFAVRDTVNKYCRYADETKDITIKDLIKFHGRAGSIS